MIPKKSLLVKLQHRPLMTKMYITHYKLHRPLFAKAMISKHLQSKDTKSCSQSEFLKDILVQTLRPTTLQNILNSPQKNLSRSFLE